MPPTHNRKTKAEPRARSQHRSLSKLFEEPDLLQLVLSRLSAEQLCLCSMVCSRMKSTIDTCLPLLQQFARDLRWWGTPFPHESVSLCFDTDKGHYSQEVQHTESARQIMWQLNIIPIVNMRVCMRMCLYLPLGDGGIAVFGDPDRVQKAYARKRVSIDVLEWKITRVHVTDATHAGKPFLGPLGSVSLCVTEYISNDVRLQLDVKYPLIATFHDVPVGDVRCFCPLSYRRLWVMRGVRNCMHCHERAPAFRSCDVETADHSVLCNNCLDLLYVREEQLPRKWRLRKLSVYGIRRAHFVTHDNRALSYATPHTPVPHLLKSSIARSRGHDSWITFIQQNHKFSHNKYARKSRFGFESGWF